MNCQDFLETHEPAVRQVAREAADAHVRIREPGARQVVHVLEDVVAHRHQVQERGHAAHFHDGGRDARAVVGDAVVFGQQRAQPDAAWRELDTQRFLHCFGIGEVVVHRRAVIEPVGVRDDVVVRVVLGFLLEAAVQVAAMHVCVHDLLAVDLRDDLDRAVRGRVRRADVDHHVVRMGRVLERAADGRAVLHRDAAYFRYGTMGCSRSIA